jgi:hypothetical protein
MGGGATSNSSTVNIGKIEVQTQATDAEGIMRDANAAAKRKFTAAQADVGMQ